MSAVFDLHCDTLTAFMTPGRCLDTLNDPQSAFALCRLPQGQSWAQCCAIFVPDGLPEGKRRRPGSGIRPPCSSRWKMARFWGGTWGEQRNWHGREW